MDTAATKSDARSETWQEIEILVEQLSELSRSQTSANRFYAELIDRAVAATGGVAGAIWSVGQDSIELQYQVNMQQTQLLADEAAAAVHEGLLRKAIADRSGGSFPPNSGGSGERESTNPTSCLIALHPVEVEERTIALIEVFQPGDCSPAAQRGCLQLLGVLAELSADFHRNWLLRQFRDRESVWNQFEQFVDRVHESTDIDETVFTVANEARLLVQCDRVTVALRKGRKYRLAAASGLDLLDRRTTAARGLQSLATFTARSGEPLWYQETEQPSEDLAEIPQSYVAQSQVKNLAVVPLRRKEPLRSGDRPFGVLIFEQFKSDGESLAQHRVEAAARHAATALGNASDVRNLPLMPLVRVLSRLRWQVRLRRLPITALILGLIASAIAALILVPADFDIEGRGELQPVQRQNLYAAMDGDVVWTVGDSGKLDVTEGRPAVILRNPQLEYEILRVGGELRTATAEWNTLRVTMATVRTGTAEGRQRKEAMSAQYKELEARIASLKSQSDKLREQESLLTVNSPMDGEVLTWNFIEKLRARPVLRGQKLMEVAKTQGQWTLELRIPEHDIGHVLDAGELTDEDLAVQFILKTDPGVEYEGRIKKIAQAVDTDANAEATVLVTVDFDEDQIPDLRPGTQVIGKIRCGQRSLGYVWLHDLWDSIRERVTF